MARSGSGRVCGLACVVGVIAGACVSASAYDWQWTGPVDGDTTLSYGNSPLEINTAINATNFVGAPLIAFEFRILPQVGFSYAPGEFEAVQFDVSGVGPNDIPPFVPPTVLNKLDATFSLSLNGQLLRFDFAPGNPLGEFEMGEFRFQIERAFTTTFFNLELIPIVPAPGVLGVLALGGLAAARRRR